jgi:hypothetical protein
MGMRSHGLRIIYESRCRDEHANGEHSGAAGFQVARFAIQSHFLGRLTPALSVPDTPPKLPH